MNRSSFNTFVFPVFFSSLAIGDNSLITVIVLLLIVVFALCVAVKCLYGQRRALKKALVGDAVCRQLFDVWPLSILVLGADGKIERMNKLLLEELQLDLRQVAGRQAVDIIELIQDKENLKIPTQDYTLTMEQFSDLVHPDDRKVLFDALAGQLTGNLYEAPVPYRLRRGDGGWEWFEGQSTYVGQLSDLPFRIVGICMSTQRHKDIEDRLNDALRKAQRSDRLKSAFLANMSHEIRTPLNAIVGFSTLLVSEQSDLRPEDIEEYAALIEKNGQLLMFLISDILDLSKIESNTMEFNVSVFSLNKMFADIARMQRLNVKPGVELIADLPAEDVSITADPVRLEQVVNNLINNAIKFTSRGSIRIGYRRRGEKDIELFVEDTGKGMSEEVIAHVFERFYKGDSFVQGTGLGLAICKTIVEHFGGEIRAESEAGEGARFEVCLPVGGK
ncbi:ATP-binding protein [Bacteroides sp.]|uniref:PAS domain-containing sensor histidine kinase n=1 Tax=Bacteroides sp. TaxID=29523 RepID=UPI00352847F8